MEKYAIMFFKNVLKMLNYMEKPKVSSGTISKSTSKLSERINITLQLLIDNMDEETFIKIFEIYQQWIENCTEDSALILVSSITSRLANKNPVICGKLVPVIIKRIL